MKLTKKQLNSIKKFAGKKLVRNDPWHGIFHTKQTVIISKSLAKKEKADLNTCIVIAWLHDICKNNEKENKDHGKEAAIKAKEFLEKLNFNKKDIKKICYAINQHNKGGKKKAIEAQIIWDADKLQGVGPYGLFRGYGHLIYIGKDQEEAYKRSMKEQKFFLKRFYTKTGKKLSKRNFNLVKKVYDNHHQLSKGKL